MTRILASVLLFLVAVLAPAAHADVAGRASVIDGDTIEIAGQRNRLHGIDAPVSAQVCFAENKSWRCGAASQVSPAFASTSGN